MSAGDSARKFYELAKHEAIERIRLRDNVLLLYLGAVATVFSLAIGRSNMEMLLSVPFLALGAAVIVCQHNLVIGDLSVFCGLEIGSFLRTLDPPEDAPQWDGSKSLKTWHPSAVRMRTVGHALLTLIPALWALSVNWCHGFYSPFPYGVLWWFGILCIFIAGVVLWSAHKQRMERIDRVSRDQTTFEK